MIVDTHVHVTTEKGPEYPQLGGAPDWPVTTVEKLVADMDSLKIDAAVLVQSYFTYGADNRYVIDSAAKYPSRFQVVAVIDQTAANAPEVLTDLVQRQGVRGLRLMPKGHSEGVLTDPKTFPAWETANRLGIPVTVAAEAQHIGQMWTLAKRFPYVPICFEHMWGLEFGPELIAQLEPVLNLAEYPNVYLKLCPNNSVAIRNSTHSSKDLYGTLAGRCGVQRLMWGSNYPAHSKKLGELADRLKIMQEDFAFMSADERDWFFCRTARGLWPMPCLAGS
jgi:predicted TIM-barrel fold metal-dependent hydrolase